jgi:lysozyme
MFFRPAAALARRARHCVIMVLTASAVVAVAAPALATSVTGPDIASYQHSTTINWASVKSSGQSFVFVKATEGTTYTNPYFASDWAASRANGLLHGAYHFARPSVGSAAAQAQRFAAVVGPAAPGDLPPTLDLEVTGGLTPTQLISWTQQFLTTLTSLTGRKPIIYTYPYFWQHSMANTAAFTGYPLWIASYSGSPTSLVWPTWTFWQYSATSTVAGISGQVDMDTFNGTPAQLAQLANVAVPAPPVPLPRVRPVKPVVTARLSSTSTTVNRTVTLSGAVRPFRAGQTIYRQGYYGGQWHLWAVGHVSRTGTFSFPISWRIRTLATYRIYVPATAGLTSAVSPTLRLRVA